MQPVHQIASNVTRKHGKKQHDKSNDLSTVDPNLSRIIHFFESKRRKLFGLINTECLTQRSSLSKQDEGQSANELTKSHISAWQLKFPNALQENSAFTSLFSFKFESQTLSKTIDIYAVSYDSRSTNALRCSQSNRVLQENLTSRAERNQNWS